MLKCCIRRADRHTQRRTYTRTDIVVCRNSLCNSNNMGEKKSEMPIYFAFWTTQQLSTNKIIQIKKIFQLFLIIHHHSLETPLIYNVLQLLGLKIFFVLFIFTLHMRVVGVLSNQFQILDGNLNINNIIMAGKRYEFNLYI